IIYVGSGSSRKVFAPGPIGNNVNMLHRKVKGLAQQMFDRANTEYSTLKRLVEMDRYLSGISTERRSEARGHYKLKQNVSTLEDQMRGLMLEDKEEKERLKKKLRVSQQEKEQIEQAFRRVIDWIRKQFGVEIPPCMGGKEATQMKQEAKIGHLHISDCAERNKVKFAAATLQGRALTWWNSQVAMLGLNVAIGKSWGDMKKMMMEEFCPNEERFHELVILCPKAVPTEKKKVEAYIKGFLENFKGETTSSRPVNMNEVVRMAHTLMEQKIQAKAERIFEGNKRKWENSQGGNRNNNPKGNYQGNNCHQQYNNQRQGNAQALTNDPAEQGETRNYCPKKKNPQGEEARGRTYVIKEVDKDQGPNVVIESMVAMRSVGNNFGPRVTLVDGKPLKLILRKPRVLIGVTSQKDGVSNYIAAGNKTTGSDVGASASSNAHDVANNTQTGSSQFHSGCNEVRADVGSGTVNNEDAYASGFKETPQIVPKSFVKLHKVPLVAYSGDGLSLIATQVRKPIMLDAFTSSMCEDSWGFARALIEISVDNVMKQEVSMAILVEDGLGYIKEVIRVEYEWKQPHCTDCKTFRHSLDTCSKCVREPEPSAMGDKSDGFTEVKRRKNKAQGNSLKSNSNPFDALNTLGKEDNYGVPKPVCTNETSNDHLDRVASGVKSKSPTGGGKKNLVFSPKSKIHYFDS
nr:hypothetical protein [Tanacetum cinerariifolium]